MIEKSIQIVVVNEKGAQSRDLSLTQVTCRVAIYSKDLFRVGLWYFSLTFAPQCPGSCREYTGPLAAPALLIYRARSRLRARPRRSDVFDLLRRLLCPLQTSLRESPPRSAGTDQRLTLIPLLCI
jgi:hypothetical protein